MANRNVPLFWGIVGIGGAVFFTVTGGAFGIVIGAILALFGIGSLKSAVYGTDKEIEEISGQRPLSKEAERNSTDRI